MNLMKKTIIVTGGMGRVGSCVTGGIRLSHAELDVTKMQDIEHAIERYHPDTILHLAAYTNMMNCQTRPDVAQQVNVDGSENVAKASRRHGIHLVYLSSCAVFDGRKKTPYVEGDNPNPLNVYGKTKYGGEITIQHVHKDSLVVRTGWLFGGDPTNDRKLVGTVIQKFLKGEPVIATDDRFGSPTGIRDLLARIDDVINAHETGLIHIANSGVASYFDMVSAIRRYGKFKDKVKPVPAREIESHLLPRGRLEAIESTRTRLRNWRPAMKEYVISVLPHSQIGK